MTRLELHFQEETFQWIDSIGQHCMQWAHSAYSQSCVALLDPDTSLGPIGLIFKFAW